MDSTLFFEDTEINSKFKDKSGIYVIEQPLFSRSLGYAVFKIGYAKNSLYTRMSDFRTAYGLIPFKIHVLYALPNGLHARRVNFAHLQERLIQETLKKIGKYTDVGEWYFDLDTILKVIQAIRENHLREIRPAKNWMIFTSRRLAYRNIDKIDLVDENSIKSKFKDVLFGRNTRSSEEPDDV
jgi:hypothetical protein